MGKNANNSTSTPLAGAGEFIGQAVNTDLPDVFVSCKSDADGILYVEFSTDGGTTWDTSVPFDCAAGVNEAHVLFKGTRSCRVRYVNGAGAQSYFRLWTEFLEVQRPLTSALKTAIQQDADALTTRSITEEVAIATGLFSGYSIVNKFGTNSDVDTATVPEDIWESGGAYTGFPTTTLETLEVLSASASDASGGTGARTVRVTGLDANYNVISETITLNGTTPVSTTQQSRRCHTATVLTAGSGGVNAGVLTVRHTTTEANVFLTIAAGRNQSNCSAYTVPAGHTAYMRAIHGSIRGVGALGTPAAVEGFIWTRPDGGVFRSRRPFIISSEYRLDDKIYGGIPFTEKSDIVLRIASTSADNVSITGGYDLILVKN